MGYPGSTHPAPLRLRLPRPLATYSPPLPFPLQTLRDSLLLNGTVKSLSELPAGFFNELIVSRIDVLDSAEQMVLKAASGDTVGQTKCGQNRSAERETEREM